jgi:hypothetical protein
MPDRDNLIRDASQAALVLNTQFNILLDAYDFYVTRFPAETPSEQLELRDLQVSIKELGSLPHQMAAQLQFWKNDEQPTISSHGFELFILNEFQLHMHSLATFMVRKKIDLEPFDPKLFGLLMRKFKDANRLIDKCVNTR